MQSDNNSQHSNDSSIFGFLSPRNLVKSMDQTTRDFFSTQHQRNNNDKFYSTNVLSNAKQIQPLTGVQWKHPPNYNQVTQPQAILPRLGSGLKPIFQNCFSTMTNLVMNRFQETHSNSPEQTYMDLNSDPTYAENPYSYPLSSSTEDCSMMFPDQSQLMLMSDLDQYKNADCSFGQIDLSENHFSSYNPNTVYQEDSLSSTSPESLGMLTSSSFDDISYMESQSLQISPSNEPIRSKHLTHIRCLNILYLIN